MTRKLLKNQIALSILFVAAKTLAGCGLLFYFVSFTTKNPPLSSLEEEDFLLSKVFVGGRF